jgi:hypothetical protein
MMSKDLKVPFQVSYPSSQPTDRSSKGS